MYSTQYLTENYNFQSFTFAVGKLAYRFAAGVADDCERIAKVVPTALHIAFTALVLLAMFVIAAVRFMLPALPVVIKAVALVSIPALAMFAVLTVPGLPLCLAVFAVFVIATWAVTK